MMKLTIGKLIRAVILLQAASQVHAQTWIENIGRYPDLKTKGVYVVMNDTTTPANKAYWHIYQKYWTYSNITFLPYAEMDQYLQDGNYFFTMVRTKTSQAEKYGYWEAYYACALRLWEYKGKSKPDSLRKEEILNGDHERHVTSLANVALFSAEENAFYCGNDYNGGPQIPKLDFYSDRDYSGTNKAGKKLYFNWSEGFLKNYLQGIQWYAAQKKELTKPFSDFYEKDKMEALKHDTLYIPEFTFAEYGKYNNAPVPVLFEKKLNPKTAAIEEKAHVKNLFRTYKYPCKVITADQLSKKLLDDPKPFHYLLYVLSGADKQITVINSENGENIFFTWTPKPKLCWPMPCPHTTEVKLHSDDVDILGTKMGGK